MNTQPHNSTKTDPFDEAFELVSRQIDGDLSEIESARLAAIEADSPAEIADFRNRCLSLQAVLQKITAVPVDRPLFCATNVHESLVDGFSKRPNGFVWATMTVIAAACLLLAIVRPWASPDSANANLSMVSGDDIHDESSTAEMPEILNSAVSPGMSGGAPAAAIAGESIVAEDANAEPSIESLLKTEDWNIVVVRVDEQDRDVAMEKIHSAVDRVGLRLQNSSEDPQSDFLGIVTTSAIAENDELVSEMEKSVAHAPVQRDSNMIAEARRQEIIKNFRESLQSPTRSELHHGMVYLAISTRSSADASPANDDLAKSDLPSSGSGAASGKSIASSADASRKSAVTDRVGARIADPSMSGATLIVFEFRSGEEGTPVRKSSEKQI